jgi:hypothetical protein
MQKLCCRQKAPPFFPTAVLLPSQHKFHQHIRPKMWRNTFLCLALFHSNDHSFEVLVGSFSHLLWRFIVEVRSHSTPSQGLAESAPLAPLFLLFWRQVLSFFQPANRSV